METFWIKAAQLVLALAILIIIHEFGHFLFARIFGIRVEKFYIFFDPWKELFKWKPGKYIGGLGKQKNLSSDPEGKEEEASADGKKKSSFWRDTEYGIGWIPLGGYCKISGMIDESMDTEQMKQPAKPYEFRSKPAWQRLLVMIAGVLFNFLLAIIIYAGIVYATGEKYVPLDKATMGLDFSPAAQKAGFRNGDMPVAADGEKLDGIPTEDRLKMMQAKEVTVMRDGKPVSISIPENFIFDLDKEIKSEDATINFFTYRIPTRITQVMPGEGAAKAGVKEGDRVIAIDGTPTASLSRTDGIEAVFVGFFLLARFLGESAENGMVVVGFLHQIDRFTASYGDGNDLSRKQHIVAQGQNRQKGGNFGIAQVGFLLFADDLYESGFFRTGGGNLGHHRLAFLVFLGHIK